MTAAGAVAPSAPAVGAPFDRERPSDHLRLRIAGLSVNVTSADFALLPHVSARPFRVAPEAESETPDMRIRVRRGPLPARSLAERQAPVGVVNASGGSRLFDSGGVWDLEEKGDTLTFRFHSPKLGEAPYKVALMNRALDQGEIVLNEAYFDGKEPVDALEYPLDEVLFVHRLWRSRAVEVHGCALRDVDGTGVLFVGHSGAGKSTMARLWAKDPGVDILSDDRVVLRVVDGRLVGFGTPWHGDACFARAESVPLTAIFLPRHSPEIHATRLDATSIVAELFTRVFIPFYDARAIDETLSLLDEIARTVPTYALGVVPEPRVVPFIRERVRAHA